MDKEFLNNFGQVIVGIIIVLLGVFTLSSGSYDMNTVAYVVMVGGLIVIAIGAVQTYRYLKNQE